MKKLLATLVTLVMIVSSLAVLTSCSDGADGLVPTVGANGNWFIGETDTGVPATGPKGDTGATGAEGPKGDRGPTGATGADAPAVEIPSLRYNETDEVYEVSYDNGATWEAIESVAGTPMELPATDPNLLDATLAEYVYPMDQIIVSDLCITYFRQIVLSGAVPGLWFHLMMLLYGLLVLGIGCLIYKKYNHKFLYYL